MDENIEVKWNTQEEAYLNLANAVILQAVEDWKLAQKILWKLDDDPQAIRLKNDCERFFHSDWYKQIFNYPAEDLLKKLPGMAKDELYSDTVNKWINAYKTLQTLKPGTKSNDKKRKLAEGRMKDAEDDFWSRWFAKLYLRDPEELIEECREQAEKEIAEEEEKKQRRLEEMRRNKEKKKKLATKKRANG